MTSRSKAALVTAAVVAVSLLLCFLPSTGGRTAQLMFLGSTGSVAEFYVTNGSSRLLVFALSAEVKETNASWKPLPLKTQAVGYSLAPGQTSPILALEEPAPTSSWRVKVSCTDDAFGLANRISTTYRRITGKDLNTMRHFTVVSPDYSRESTDSLQALTLDPFAGR
jgi:hypothetical protein